MFQEATRQKLRFSTQSGNLTTEQLWDLSVTELDKLAVELKKEYKESGGESFIVKKTAKDKTAKLRFDVVLAILTVKLEEQEKASTARERKEHNAKIDALIARKQDQELENLNINELKKLKK